MKEIENMKELFDSFQEYIESEDMVFKTLHASMTIANKDK
jgi:hypothetical protein